MPVWERTAHPLGQIQSLSQGEHLPDDTLQALHLSDRNALWVATNSGVARVAWPDPVAVVREPPALQTTIGAITRHEGHLVVGIRKGVWRAAPRPLTRLAATGQTFDLLSTEAGLLVASGEGVALVRGGTTRVLTETPAYGSTGAPKIRRPSTSLATRRVFSVSSGGTLSGGFRTRRIESTPPSTRWPRIREEPSDWAPGTAVSFDSTWRMPT